MIQQPDWTSIVQTYAPRVTLTNNHGYVEDDMPSSVDWFLPRASLRDHDDSSFRIDSPSVDQLIANNGKSKYLTVLADNYLKGDLHSAVMYAHVRSATPGPDIGEDWIDIQYWFFYPNNGKTGGIIVPMGIGGDHQGDWEHVTVRVSDWDDPQKAQIRGVFYAAHTYSEGAWQTRPSETPTSGRYATVNGTHPLVFSAYHSHASYESTGYQFRYAGFATDVTGGGQVWSESKVELVSVDDNLPGGDTVPDAGWLPFLGRWGNDGSPRGPSQHGTWKDDGDNGYTTQLIALASIGDDWSSGRGVTGVAFGALASIGPVFAVSSSPKSSGGGNRFYLFKRDGSGLMDAVDGGDGWGDSRTATGIAFGVLEGQPVLGVSRTSNNGGNARFFVYAGEAGDLVQLTSGGGDWSKKRDATDIAFGLFGGYDAVGVTRTSNSSGGARFYVYRWDSSAGALVTLAEGGSDWGSSRDATAVSFGRLGNKDIVGVTRTSEGGGNDRFFLYTYDKNAGSLRSLASGGSDWNKKRDATDIAFGALDGQPVVGVARSSDGDGGSRFYVYRWDAATSALVEMASGGGDWDKTASATAIAFGTVNGQPVVAATSDETDDSRVYLYTYDADAGTLSPYAEAGEGWGSSRYATALAFGIVNGESVIGVGRNKGNNTRATIYGWRLPD